MGRDKAWIDWNGCPLWSVQLARLRSLHPSRLLIACREEQQIHSPDAEVFHDPPENAGPLPAILRCLEEVQMPLLALAVDMPAMEAAFLSGVVEAGLRCGKGVIYHTEAHGYEPLAALYPTEVVPLLHAAVAAQDFRLQALARVAADAGLLSVHRPSALEETLFRNVNTPDDLQ